MLKPDSVYGFAKHEDVEQAINQRLDNVAGGKLEAIAAVLGEATEALKEINETIPVQSRHRHLIANALEHFCNSGS